MDKNFLQETSLFYKHLVSEQTINFSIVNIGDILYEDGTISSEILDQPKFGIIFYKNDTTVKAISFKEEDNIRWNTSSFHKAQVVCSGNGCEHSKTDCFIEVSSPANGGWREDFESLKSNLKIINEKMRDCQSNPLIGTYLANVADSDYTPFAKVEITEDCKLKTDYVDPSKELKIRIVRTIQIIQKKK